MITWSSKSMLLAGIGLILLTNVVALGGVGYNRSGEPESTLRLSGRELVRPWDWGFNRENSGMALTLQWRTLGRDIGGDGGYIPGYAGGGASPAWLDDKKLASLGFDTSPRGLSDARSSPRAKQAFLVLELDGDSYRAAVERARQYANQQQALHVGNPGIKELEQKARDAEQMRDREENENTRLFVIDAGRDVDALREQYPDRNRYAVVRGSVQAYWNEPRSHELRGYVQRLSVDQINVPLSLRPLWAAPKLDARPAAKRLIPRGEVNVAFGRRLEPWIVAVTIP